MSFEEFLRYNYSATDDPYRNATQPLWTLDHLLLNVFKIHVFLSGFEGCCKSS